MTTRDHALLQDQLDGQASEIAMIDKLLGGDFDRSQIAEIAYEWGGSPDDDPLDIAHRWLANQLEIIYLGRRSQYGGSWDLTGIEILTTFGGPTIRVIRMNTEPAHSHAAIRIVGRWWSEHHQSEIAAPHFAEWLDAIVNMDQEVER